MNLTDIYRRLVSAKIDLRQAAAEFGVPLAGLKTRLTKWGDRMPLMLVTLDRIVAGAVSRTEAARTLGVSERQVNALMASWDVQRPLKEYLVAREVSALKWDVRKRSAIDFIAGRSNLEIAAAAAGISERQLRRWVTELLEVHGRVTFKELTRMPEALRQTIAGQVVSGHQIDDATKEAVDRIVSGDVPIQREAVRRVSANAQSRRFREIPDV